jgi:hypothetical protein
MTWLPSCSWSQGFDRMDNESMSRRACYCELVQALRALGVHASAPSLEVMVERVVGTRHGPTLRALDTLLDYLQEGGYREVSCWVRVGSAHGSEALKGPPHDAIAVIVRWCRMRSSRWHGKRGVRGSWRRGCSRRDRCGNSPVCHLRGRRQQAVAVAHLEVFLLCCCAGCAAAWPARGGLLALAGGAGGLRPTGRGGEPFGRQGSERLGRLSEGAGETRDQSIRRV